MNATMNVYKETTSTRNVKIDRIYHKYANEQRGDSRTRGCVEI